MCYVNIDMSMLQTQAKANMTRDYYTSERLSQLRTTGGRQSSVADSRRGESEAHEREVSPKPGASASNISATRKPRACHMFSLSMGFTNN